MHALYVTSNPTGERSTFPASMPNPATGEKTGAQDSETLIHETLEAMDQYNVVKGYLFGPLENVYRWVDEAPGRFIPSPNIRGDPPSPDAELIRAEYQSGKIEAIGEVGTQYDGIPPNDIRLEPIFSLAEELDIPIITHTCGLGAPRPSFRSALGNPLLLEDVVVKHPKLRLIVENAGYPFLSEITALMLQYPQVYADISTISWIISRESFHDYLESLMKGRYMNSIGKRLLFGSDQMVWAETIGMAVDAVESADFLSEEQKRDIFYNNAARFLRLDE